jgi:hypothetical protein
MDKVELLHALKAAKFEEICGFVARELGLGHLSSLSRYKRSIVEDEAELIIERWGEMAEMGTCPNLRRNVPVRRLLSQYNDICGRILDERDIEIGIWAHQRRSQKRKLRRTTV